MAGETRNGQLAIARWLSATRCRGRWIADLLLSTFFLVAPPVWAQAAGQFEREFAQPPPFPSGEGPEVPQTSGQALPPDAEKIRFTLKRIDLAGNNVYPESALRSLYAPLLGREISLAQIFRTAEDITTRYRNDGYVLTRAVVPAQSIRDGVVRIDIVEGFVAETPVRGTSLGPRSTIDQHLAAIRNSHPLNASVLERELLLINDLPGVTARSTLGPSATPGASDMTIELAEQRVSAFAGVNNRGSKSLGPWRADIGGNINQLFGGYDSLAGRLVQTFSNEMTFVSAGYDRTAGATGARLGISGTYLDSQPTTGQNFNLPTNSQSAAAYVNYPWLRSRAQNLSSRLSFSYLDSKTDQTLPDGTVQPISKDNIRAVRFGTVYDVVDRFRGVSVIDVEISQGLEVLSSSEDGDPILSVQGGHPDFTKVTLYAARLQSIAPKWSILGAINAQYGATTLLSPERFAFGGEQFGRAYDIAELTGDSGAALKTELRFTDSTRTIVRNYTWYGFFEIGEVYRRGTSIATTGQKQRESASDFGLGLRFSLRRYVTGYIEVAKPLTKEVAQEGNKDPRVFVGVQATY
jgi:hemolysin activation/secretion protein